MHNCEHQTLVLHPIPSADIQCKIPNTPFEVAEKPSQGFVVVQVLCTCKSHVGKLAISFFFMPNTHVHLVV